ncbi:MAG: branched-chain amino acid aminotransferase [Desulfovibrio sp.]|jgi:branched-chain amino acid aminotransferase|nr:branched-chain amino acid aminotransferase [Desulfovibrio sp.]
MRIEYRLLPKNEQKSPPPEGTDLSFGTLRTNHMFLMEYSDGAWRNARIVPYAPFSLLPGSMCFHYGQCCFEGVKAFKHKDGEIYIFRPDQNVARHNHSAEVLCMPSIPVEVQLDAMHRLVDVERAWCPSEPQSSLYIRPFMFATQDTLGVKPSASLIYCIMLSPSGAYYKGGFNHAVRLLITKKYHRAVSGGTGSAKAAGNYAASIRPQIYAQSFGVDQVLYLSADNTCIEEVGTMNHYHVLKDGTFIIPEFSDSVLRAITSVSVLELAAAGRIKARQEVVYLDKFTAGIKSGEIIEAGGFGTAAVVSPVGGYVFEDGTELVVGNGEIGEHSRRLYEMYTAIQTGKTPAPQGWLSKVPRWSF